MSLTLGAIAAALVAKASEEAAERAVEGSAGALGRLVGWLRTRFAADDEKEGTSALARVEDASDSPSNLRVLAQVLDRRAETDAGFREELAALVDEARAGDIDLGSIAQTVWGNQNVQAGGIINSEITVTYGQPRPGPGR